MSKILLVTNYRYDYDSNFNRTYHIRNTTFDIVKKTTVNM